MAGADNVVFAVLAWIIAATCALSVSIMRRRRESWVDRAAVSFLSGFIAFAVIGYFVRNADGVDGSEWYYLAIAVAVGAFGRKIFDSLDKRTDQIFEMIFARVGMAEDERKHKKNRDDGDHGDRGDHGGDDPDSLEDAERHDAGDGANED